MSKRILITGGAGYIGTILTSYLLRQNYHVRVIDNLLYGGESILPFLLDENYEFIKGDVRDTSLLKKIVQDIDAIVHLAAIVGFPICSVIPDVALEVNVEATKTLTELATKSKTIKRFIFASTYSNYGISPTGEAVTEDSPLNPVSLYAETKIKAEKIVLNINNTTKPTVLRFATAFGFSPRMRFDLIINQFALEMELNKYLEVYQKNYYRSYIHVQDIVKAILKVLEVEDSLIDKQIFNVGGAELNYTKEEIANVIKQFIPNVKLIIKDYSIDGDMRSISVCYDKVNKVLGFKPSWSVKKGVEEILGIIRNKIISNPKDSRYYQLSVAKQ
ncbi:MAG: NAD(P)-dependent oxidoreductase [bacterium]|nr:NAD(P)-dependent oxidoreductase [bacterium]